MKENSEQNNNNCNNEKDHKSICSKLINLQSLLSKQQDKDINQLSTLLNFFEKIEKLYSNFSKFQINKNDFSENNLTNNIIDSFYNFHIEFFDNFKNIPIKINKEIIEPLKKAKLKFEKLNKKIIISLKDIIEQLSLHQDVLNLIKKEYYDESKKLELIEKNNKKEDGNNKNDNQIILKMSNQTKLIENKFSLYKKEVEVMKKLYSDGEKDFKNLRQRIQETNNSKNNAIYSILSNYFKIITNIIKDLNNENISLDINLTKYKSMLSSNQINEELYNIILELNGNWKYDFDISSQNIEKSDNNNEINNEINNDKNNEEKTKEKEKTKIPIKFEDLIIMPKNNYEIEGIDINYMELNKNFYEKLDTESNEEREIFSKDLSNIPDFFKILFSDNIVQSEQKNKITNILEKYQGNINNYITFCDSVIYSSENELNYFEFKSFSNFAYFSNLLKNLLDNISEKLLINDIKAYELFDKIISFGEKCVYGDTYMCGLISSENSLFKKEIIWKRSIMNKLINLYQPICKKEYSNQNNNDSNNLRKSIGVLGKFFQRKESGKNRNNIIEFYELDKYIKIYKQLNDDKIKNINSKYGQKVLHEVIKCYIRHMINYNYLSLNNYKFQVEKIINDIINEFSINDTNQIEYYNLYFFSNIYSIKRPIINREEKLRKNLLIEFNNNNRKNDKNKIFFIKKSLKFLDKKEKINLINLCKKYSKINKYIYYKILKQDNDFNSQRRIGIWKIVLEYKKSLKKYDYKNILNEVTKIPFNEKEGSDFLIAVDIKRTKFKAKDNDGQKILCNLLRCLVYNNDTTNEETINYCQGMNFIAALFYDIIKDEEETFHLLKSFFINGKFGIIFKNRLSKLKDYFTILEKLIFLILPKIHHKLIVNQIQVSIFASPYFVTLFTNVYYYHPNNANKFLLHSLDDFILEGWSSVFSTIICVFKYFEKKILDLNGEELIKFIVNDIGRSDLFTDDNYDIFYKLKKNNLIKNVLLNYLEEETKIEKKIKAEFNNNN